ncbi:MAG: cyclic nucleotide-binding domain-containing protein [Myxococcaceae bacterium]|nr:cyclic nucleotide-binding domain-containing protein [Myxococcaceae bacterium]
MEVRKLRDKATEAFAKGRFSRAAEFYEDYCKAEPKDFQARLRQGDAWAKAGQKDRAISAYQFAAQGFAREGFLPRAIAASKLILELDPAHRGVQQMLADLYARKSAGGNGAAQRAPARKVELPSFTEHMGVSMGPNVAPLELPEEDEEAAPVQPPPQAHASPAVEPREEEELLVVQGVPLPPTPVAPGVVSPPAALKPAPREPVRAQLPPPTPAVPASFATGPTAREPARTQPLPPAPAAPASPVVDPPRPSEPAAAPVMTTPPGLAPRAAAQRPSVAVPVAPAEPPRPAPPAQPVAAPAALSAPTASQEETALEVDLGRGVKKLSWTAVGEPLFPTAAPASESSPPAPASAAPPGLRPRRATEAGGPDMALTPAPGQSAVPRPPSSAFTELELEADTLLHAVEEAAIAGIKQRAAASSESVDEEDEEIILTEEVPAPGSLPNIPLFSDLPQDAFIELFERCPLRRYAVGQRVFDQGSHGDAFYVICEGSVRVVREEGRQRKELATLGSGAFFGEMALLSGASRMASVESAAEDTQLLEISAPLLAELSRQHPQVARALKKFCRERLLSNVMSTSALFEPFGRKDRRALVEKFRAREVKRNEIIVREGERTDGLYVVLSGEVEARKGDQVLSRLKEGELFGEISLLSKTPATATVLATRRTSLLRLPREDFDALILSHPQILVLVSELSEQRLRRTEALTGSPALELRAEELLV